MVYIRTVFLLLCYSYSCAFAQSLPIQSITVADGLSQGLITAFYQDRHGFMWIGTLDGLNRYDGYSIRRFSRQPFSKFSLFNSAHITQIQEDANGLLWIGTDESLYIFDPATERFFNINEHTPQLPKQNVSGLALDSRGTVIAHMPGKSDSIGLFRILVPPGFTEQLRQNDATLQGLDVKRIALAPNLRIQTPIGLEACMGDTLLLVRDWLGRGFRMSGPDYNLRPFDLLTFKTADPSILWNDQYGAFFRRRLSDGRDSLVSYNAWRRIIRLKEGKRLFISGADNRLFEIRKNGPLQSDVSDLVQENELFQREFSTFLSFPYGVSTIFRDRSDILWVGTGGHGLQRMNIRNLSFRQLCPRMSLYNLRQMPDGRIWCGKSNPHTLLNLASGEMETAPWAAYFQARKKIIYNLLPDRSGNIWFITAGAWLKEKGGIYVWEKRSNTYRAVATIPVFKELVTEQLLEDKRGNIWIAAHEGHLFLHAADKPKLEHLNYAAIFGDYGSNLSTNAIMEDGDGEIWIGTSQGLVGVKKPGNDAAPVYRLYQHEANNLKSLSWNWILCICPDPSNPDLLWIGTRGGGLNCFNKKSQTFTCYTEANGLADNVVYGILPDKEGNFWCSTNRGLSRFSPKTGTFINYYESDGLQNNEFNTGAFLLKNDSLLLFGGINGLTLFNPARIKRNNQPPPIAITSIRVRGNLLAPAQENSPLQFAPYFDQTLTLPFFENNVSFEFAALDFANPATNRYRYQMLGIDRDWNYSGTAHSANYASLPPGKYTFMVQAATADGEWSTQSATFMLVILPPWYRRRLAYLAYLLLAVFLAAGFIRSREKHLREQHALQLKQQESERLQELDSFKNRLFANITHEFRTPLTIILGLAERLRRGHLQPEALADAASIAGQGNNLLQLVNQMLDLTKLESQSLKLHPVQSNLSAFIRHETEAFRSLGAYKNLKINVLTEPSELVMDFDPQRLRQIVGNLLANAIRHSLTGGEITMHLYQQDDKQAVLNVRDNGEGISASDLPHIFDRFYQGNASEQKQGSGGIGLALTRELVLLAGGRISVQSAPGQGALFSVVLPITRQAEIVRNEDIAAIHQIDPVEPPVVPKAGEQALLLLIEDNEVIARFLQRCLEPYYRLLLATDGEKGLKIAFQFIPDIILSDVMMPAKNGFELTEILKNDKRTSHIPIVLLTAKTQINDRLDGLRRGANAYLVKPFNEEELLLVLHNQLEMQAIYKKRYAVSDQGLPTPITKKKPNSDPEKFRLEDEFMQKLYGIFETHYSDEQFNLDQLCRILGISNSQLHRKLKALTDQPAMHMLGTFRLHKARELLLSRRDLQIAEICLMVGFGNSAHFSRMFSKTFGVPPSALRKEKS